MKFIEALKTRWVVWVWNHTPNCAEMSRLASLSFEQTPTLRVRLEMWLHYLICVWCERCAKHLKFLRHAAPRLQQQAGVSNRKMSEESKQRMAARLRQEIQD